MLIRYYEIGKKFLIGHLNARSMFLKFLYFKDLIVDNDYDIFCITETWLTEAVRSSNISIDGYRLIRADRATNKGGEGFVYILEITLILLYLIPMMR